MGRGGEKGGSVGKGIVWVGGEKGGSVSKGNVWVGGGERR